ncbi:MAG TPA: 3-isopropylmalate dehydratase small subunit [Burkholderiaceae bacterium]|nr:3-isopropylmalate dehydratase small subunit [Burkholderiaceae bacterium]
MIPFTRLQAVAMPLPRPNLDTDQILPARYLQKPRDVGFAQFLFDDVRRLADGSRDPAFPLNQPVYRDARIVVGGANFACGSSREHAVWALADHGFRAVIAPGFGDIFRGNAPKNGLLPVVLPAADVEHLLNLLAARPGASLTIDLQTCEVGLPDDSRRAFDIEPFARHCLLNGLDEIDYTLTLMPQIEAFERRMEEREMEERKTEGSDR